MKNQVVYRNVPILAMATNDWAGPWMNRQQLLSRLAKRGWRVVYSTGALSFWDRDKPHWKAAHWQGDAYRDQAVQVDRPGRWLPRWPSHRWWDNIAIRHHANRLLQTFGCKPGDDFILYVFDPGFWPYLPYLRPRWVVFHIRDAY